MNNTSTLKIMVICTIVICFMNTLQLNGLHKSIRELDDRLNNSQIYEYPKAIDPTTGADSSLIEQCNFFVGENVRLENYIIELEQENKILGSALTQNQNKDESNN